MLKGVAENYEEIIKKIIDYTTDKNLFGDKAWTLMRNEPWPRGTILKCGGLKGKDTFYIGLMPLDVVKGKTYKDWVISKDVLSTYFVWSEKYLNQIVPFELNKGSMRILLKPPEEEEPHEVYYFHNPEIFFASAKVLYFGIFKQYSEGLDWHEQPGGMDFINTKLMPIQYHKDDLEHPIPNPTKQDWFPPMFPGAGYPAIATDETCVGQMEFYAAKHVHGLTVGVKRHDKEGLVYWELGHSGFFKPYADYEYSFPASLVGTTAGLTMKGESRYYSSGQSSPTPVTGLQFDYRVNNWSLVHGTPSIATAGRDDEYCPTQVAAMLPDGVWRHFANFVQGVDVVPLPKVSNVYKYPNSAPKRVQVIQSFIRPTEQDIYEGYNVYSDNIDENFRRSDYKFEPLELVEKKHPDGLHILGRLSNFYHSSRQIYQYGKLKINGSHHLMLPNIWEGRKYHLPYYYYYQDTYEYSQETLLKKDKEAEKERKKFEDVMNVAVELKED